LTDTDKRNSTGKYTN